MSEFGFAIIGILAIAIIAEFSPKLGWGLAVLALLGMIATIYKKG